MVRHSHSQALWSCTKTAHWLGNTTILLTKFGQLVMSFQRTTYTKLERNLNILIYPPPYPPPHNLIYLSNPHIYTCFCFFSFSAFKKMNARMPRKKCQKIFSILITYKKNMWSIIIRRTSSAQLGSAWAGSAQLSLAEIRSVFDLTLI